MKLLLQHIWRDYLVWKAHNRLFVRVWALEECMKRRPHVYASDVEVCSFVGRCLCQQVYVNTLLAMWPVPTNCYLVCKHAFVNMSLATWLAPTIFFT